MISIEEIQSALHASRVIEHGVANPHGPLGLEPLAARVREIQGQRQGMQVSRGVQRPITLGIAAWEHLDEMAEMASRTTTHPVSASEIAAAILEHYVATPPLPQ
jgi:hypothetical protein